MRVARPAFVLAALAAVTLATSAAAAPGPNTLSFKDPAGDNVSPSAASDIAGVTFTTSGSGKGKGYVAKKLVLTMTLAKPPSSDAMVVYGIETELAGCGQFYVTYMPGATLLESFNYAGCGGDGSDPTGDGTSFDGAPEVKGNSIVWTLPFKALPGGVKQGSTFSDITGYTDFVDPATSIFGPKSLTGTALYDTASSSAPYKVG